MKAVLILEVDRGSPAHTQLETALGLQAVTDVAKREIAETVLMALDAASAAGLARSRIGDGITLPIVTEADARSQFQFAVTLAQQVIDLERNSHALNLVGRVHDKREVAITIGIPEGHAIAHSVIALETGVKIDAHKIVNALQLELQAALGETIGCRLGRCTQPQAQ